MTLPGVMMSIVPADLDIELSYDAQRFEKVGTLVFSGNKSLIFIHTPAETNVF